MKWTKFTLQTTTLAVDLISSMLDDLGVEGIEIEDHVPLTEEEKRLLFADIVPDLEPDDGFSTVHFYRDINEDYTELLEQIKIGLQELSTFVELGDGKIEITQTEDINWINNWKEFFKPFRISTNIVIKPTWEELEETEVGDIVIEIDPGIAFGTGSHETTKLCILALKNHITKDMKILDVGCGSGILSIAALKFGATFALGIDIDPCALSSTFDNMNYNSIPKDSFDAISGNIIADEDLQQRVGFQQYDIAVANILADVIIPLTSTVGKHIKPSGLFISSGIIIHKKEEVKQALLTHDFTIIETIEMGDWVSFVAKKNS